MPSSHKRLIRPGSCGGGGGGGGYTAKAVHFAGASVNLANASLQCTDSQYVAASMWLHFDPAGQNGGEIFTVDPQNNYGTSLAITSSATFTCGLGNATGNPFLGFGGAGLGTNQWHLMLFAAQTNFAAGSKLVAAYIDDTNVTANITDNGASFLTALSNLPFWIGDDSFGDGYVGDMADFRLMVGENLLVAGDIPLAKRRLFIDGSGKPVDPATATASLGSPIVLLSGDHTTFPTNQGTGGAFTLTGSLTNASTHP